MTLKSDSKFDEKLACCLENEEFCKFSPEHLKVSKIGTLIKSFCPKWKIYELQIYSGVVCYDNEE